MKNLILKMDRPEQGAILAGRLDGQRMFVRLLEELGMVSTAILVILDFAGIEIATSSFLAEAVVRLRDHLRLGRAPSYLAVANLNPKVSEELEDLLARSGDALMACEVSSDGNVGRPELLGRLEPKLRETFDLVQKKGETNAVELHSESSDSDQIGPTAWNNRLNLLSAKSLLVEIPRGRMKKFRPLLEVA
jgi:hypothetical protein